MRTGFEINGDYRLMDSAELVYILTNSAVMVNKVQETVSYTHLTLPTT